MATTAHRRRQAFKPTANVGAEAPVGPVVNSMGKGLGADGLAVAPPKVSDKGLRTAAALTATVGRTWSAVVQVKDPALEKNLDTVKVPVRSVGTTTDAAAQGHGKTSARDKAVAGADGMIMHQPARDPVTLAEAPARTAGMKQAPAALALADDSVKAPAPVAGTKPAPVHVDESKSTCAMAVA